MKVYSVQYNGYNLIGVTTVERGDGSYDSTDLFLYIRQLIKLGLYTVHNMYDGAAVRRYNNTKPVSTVSYFYILCLTAKGYVWP